MKTKLKAKKMTNKSAVARQKVSGVILIDKPQGMTSQQVVSKVKYLFQSPAHNSKKAGHTGTLDPMATGLLPICLERQQNLVIISSMPISLSGNDTTW